jgi:hypothetical protein
VNRKAFALAPLLERRRCIERRCLQAWIALERERVRSIALLARLDAGLFASCGGPAATGWWQAQTALAIGAVRERLAATEKACRCAQVELHEATLQRRVLEKLEERWTQAEDKRRARLQHREDDEANRLACAASVRAGTIDE